MLGLWAWGGVLARGLSEHCPQMPRHETPETVINGSLAFRVGELPSLIGILVRGTLIPIQD